MQWFATVILAGDDDPIPPEAAAVMARGLRAWARSGRCGISLPRFMGLPSNPEKARLRLRDDYLREAAAALEIDRPWQRATALHEAARRFMRHEWLCWCDLDAPPAHASVVDHWLFLATKAAGGELPETARRMDQIVNV
ncbi:hypothetical protein JI739_07745 [Ramlibacter sp. AW1]|uniref:Uncharacterized protein n=1 Tax=Ramlibacter aurantiacus TaxID=2801330 RepID=A0A937D5S9_9BURK|nr:hypothetical protein [Ramlibacter aurantiacus]MBL0420233.1 hypothetical protein [Ramlibacter aurantiacus]